MHNTYKGLKKQRNEQTRKSVLAVPRLTIWNSRPAKPGVQFGKKTSRAEFSTGRPFCRAANRSHENSVVVSSMVENSGPATGRMEKQPAFPPRSLDPQPPRPLTCISPSTLDLYFFLDPRQWKSIPLLDSQAMITPSTKPGLAKT